MTPGFDSQLGHLSSLSFVFVGYEFPHLIKEVQGETLG